MLINLFEWHEKKTTTKKLDTVWLLLIFLLIMCESTDLVYKESYISLSFPLQIDFRNADPFVYTALFHCFIWINLGVNGLGFFNPAWRFISFKIHWLTPKTTELGGRLSMGNLPNVNSKTNARSKVTDFIQSPDTENNCILVSSFVNSNYALFSIYAADKTELLIVRPFWWLFVLSQMNPNDNQNHPTEAVLTSSSDVCFHGENLYHSSSIWATKCLGFFFIPRQFNHEWRTVL